MFRIAGLQVNGVDLAKAPHTHPASDLSHVKDDVSEARCLSVCSGGSSFFIRGTGSVLMHRARYKYKFTMVISALQMSIDIKAFG